jgi:antirestriction protein
MSETATISSARVYVGTCAKYNNGSIRGAWLDLSDYADADAFNAACLALHKDESDPELMFQDFEGFPRSFYGESYIKPELWAWLDLSEDDRNILEAYQNCTYADADIDQAREAFQGTADTEKDFAAQYWEDAGMLEGVPENVQNYIDYEAVARDMRLGGDFYFERHDGTLYVFSAH